MKKYLIVANWKMNKTKAEAQAFVRGLEELKIKQGREVVICPPFTLLSAVKWPNLGGQDLFWEAKGAYTGEISPLQLKDAGCRWVIIGHSERRQYFGETNQTVNKKIKAALNSELKVIFCVGETLQERENNETEKVITRQISEGLENLNLKPLTLNLIIAYEPIWAIGTGINAQPEQAQEVHVFIKKLIKTKIIYGGSVTPDNISSLMAQPAIDGALVGGASLDLAKFSQIINFS